MGGQRSGRPSAEERIVALYRRSGYVRTPDTKPSTSRGHRGYEVRLVVDDEREAALASRYLTQAGLRPSKPFRKRSRLVVAVHGRDAVEWIRKASRRSNRPIPPFPRPAKPRAKGGPRHDARWEPTLRALKKWAGPIEDPRALTARRRAILFAVASGVSQTAIAAALGLTRQRVNQIIQTTPRRPVGR